MECPNESQSELSVEISFDLKNTSNIDGDEVAQLYLKDVVSSTVTPLKQLKKFKRINLKAGEQQHLTFTLTGKDLQLLDRKMKWVVEPGDFEVMVGASSEDIRLKDKFVLNKAW